MSESAESDLIKNTHVNIEKFNKVSYHVSYIYKINVIIRFELN